MKRIVICCDGTWNTPNKNTAITNVVKMSRSIAPEDHNGMVQVVYYDEGVGSRGSLPGRVWAGMTGSGLEQNVNDAYFFVVDNYAPGDELFLFGFSRGAFTVRSLVGMIRKCGLLAKPHADRASDAYWLYRDGDAPVDGDKALALRRDYGVNSKIHVQFVGVWDTVGALGIPFRPLALTRKKHEFHDLRLSTYVANACQALAIDEQRVHFPPAIWQVQDPSPPDERVPLAPPEKPQNVEQAWFAGVHSNIGGGYVDSGLSDLTFQWMKERAMAAGLAFDEEYLATIMKPSAFGFVQNSRTGFYKAFAAKPRTIADPKLPKSQERVDPNAEKRWAGDSRYRPKPLADYYKRIGRI